MNHHIGHTSSNTDTQSGELQLAVLTQQKKRPLRDILLFEVKHYRHQDEVNLLLNTAKQLNYHYFAREQQLLLFFTREGITSFTNCFSLVSN